MLNPSDVYVSGGSSDLRVCWTDKVTKYDASSFYNWEQDNLPLHDLDERTHLLWERLGAPTSAITGMTFIVSAGADEGCFPSYFATLSSCMEALPDVINYPILVEVVSFGDLGSLEIPSKVFGPRGSLEIVNRNCSFGGGIALSGGDAFAVQEFNTDYTDYDIASAVVPAGDTLTQISTNTSAPSLPFDMYSSKTYTSGVYAASSANRYDDARYGTVGKYVFSRRVSSKNNRMTAALSSTIQPWETTGTIQDTSSFKFEAFDAPAARRTTEMNTYDVSTLNYLTNNEVKWGIDNDGTFTDGAAAFAYANHLTNIKVQNCNGPIYIRNFTVDAQHVRDNGIEILNSDVFLERCSVSRANKAGLYADNSNVVLLRGFVAYRNYELVNSVRTGTPFSDKRINYKSQDSYGAGIYALNSTINVSSTFQRDIDKSTEASGSVYDSYTGSIPSPSVEALFCLSRNDIGLHAINSHITGGRTELDGSSTPRFLDAMQLFMELNTEAGIKLEQSKFDNKGRVLLYGNYRGIDSSDSKIETDCLKCTDNQAEALLLNNSTFVYGKEPYDLYTYGTTNQYRFDQVTLVDNGTHLKANNSIVTAGEASSVPSVFSQFYTSGAFGVANPLLTDATLNNLLPSVDVSRNSDVELVHFVGNRRSDLSTLLGNDRPVYGSIVKVDKNSSVVMRGSHKFANILAGPTGREHHIHHAGVFCNNNSTVSFQGPTVIGSLGVDVLADNNSKMEFVPHRNNDGELLVDTYDLSNPHNHTTVELHSTRACLVSKGSSEVVMQDLGNYYLRYGGGVHGAELNASADFDYLQNGDGKNNDAVYRNNVSAGYIQFYPNAYINDLAITNSTNGTDLSRTGNSYFTQNSFTNSAGSAIPGKENYYLKLLTDGSTATDIDEISTGGMCLRALEGSKVNITNVHFPAGWHNASGLVYDLSGDIPNCSRLFMWNIADDSVLHANYVSVSGLHPLDAGYHGPSGDWGVASALSSTPDTSAISVLDYYGPSPQLSATIGTSVHKNLGPFRLFFSTDPVANYLMPSSQDLSGYIPQLYSQGYQPSANVIAANSNLFNASAEHFSLLKHLDQANATGDIVPSGYYYASDMVYNPYTIKAVLDESAANLFANAKHNSVGKSKLAKVVHIYYPYREHPIGGDSYSQTDTGSTLGLASVNNFDLEKNN